MSDSPFHRVVDDLTGGCGCACHTGIGYNAACDHCQPSTVRTEGEGLAPAGLDVEAMARSLKKRYPVLRSVSIPELCMGLDIAFSDARQLRESSPG